MGSSTLVKKVSRGFLFVVVGISDNLFPRKNLLMMPSSSQCNHLMPKTRVSRVVVVVGNQLQVSTKDLLMPSRGF